MIWVVLEKMVMTVNARYRLGFGIATLLVVIGLFFCWRTGQVYDALRLEWLQRLQQVPGMAVTWLDEDRGLFHRQSQIHLCVLDPERILSSEQLPQLPSHLQALLRHSGVADVYNQPGYPGSAWPVAGPSRVAL